MGEDFINNDEPQRNQIFCQMNECNPMVVKAEAGLATEAFW